MTSHDFKIIDPDLGVKVIRKTHAETNPERHFHDSWEILCIISGERTFFYANRTLSIHSGDIICIQPGILHRSINRKNETCDLFTLNFAVSSNPFFQTIVPLLTACGTRNEPIISIREIDRYRFSAGIISIARELEEKRIGYLTMASAHVYQMLVELVRYIPTVATESTESPINRKAALIIDYLASHYREDITLTNVARHFGMGETTLSRMFRQSTRFTFIEYLTTLRIQEACRLLSTTEKNVTEIAGLCGFGSITQFGRCFRKISGNSPLSWRKKQRESSARG